MKERTNQWENDWVIRHKTRLLLVKDTNIKKQNGLRQSSYLILNEYKTKYLEKINTLKIAFILGFFFEGKSTRLSRVNVQVLAQWLSKLNWAGLQKIGVRGYSWAGCGFPSWSKMALRWLCLAIVVMPGSTRQIKKNYIHHGSLCPKSLPQAAK